MNLSSIRNLDKNFLKILLAIYIPGFFVHLGNSLVLSFNPLYARDLGADIGMIGLILAAEGIGRLVIDLPSGWLARKIPEKLFLLLSLAGLVIFCLLKGMAQVPLHLFTTSLLVGIFSAAWGLGQLAYMRRRIPPEYRGRAMAYMAGIMRFTRIISPAAGGLFIKFFGFRIIFFIQAGFALAAFILVSALIKQRKLKSIENLNPNNVLKETFRKDGKNILAAVVGITGLMFVRMSRNLLVPLWSDHIGVSVELIGLLLSVGGILETLMVVPAGHILDKAGRKWTAVPCTLGLSISLMLMPLAGNFVSLGVIFCLMSIANGLGSGINLTISLDLSPKNAASEFLGIWRFITDTSQITGPSIAAYIAQVFILSLAPVFIGGIGIAAGFILLFGMKETKT